MNSDLTQEYAFSMTNNIINTQTNLDRNGSSLVSYTIVLCHPCLSMSIRNQTKRGHPKSILITAKVRRLHLTESPSINGTNVPPHLFSLSTPRKRKNLETYSRYASVLVPFLSQFTTEDGRPYLPQFHTSARKTTDLTNQNSVTHDHAPDGISNIFTSCNDMRY